MKENELIGKTIVDAEYKRLGEYDDSWLELTFSDGTKKLIVADYGGWTGNSMGEYPRFIVLRDNMDEEDFE